MDNEVYEVKIKEKVKKGENMRTLLIIFIIIFLSLDAMDSPKIRNRKKEHSLKDVILETGKINNFSFYNPDGSPGVIGSNDREDNLKSENPSFWKKLSYSIGYSGGICWTGKDLKRYADFIGTPFDWLYWLNSIEGSVIYPLSEKSRIEIGIGYGWTKIEGDRWLGNDWLIWCIGPGLGIIYSKWKYTIFFYYMEALWFKNQYYGRGLSWKGNVQYSLNSVIKAGFSLGNGNINYCINTTPDNVSVLFYGVNFSLMLNLKIRR